MFKIALINMPFADAPRPSRVVGALTQPVNIAERIACKRHGGICYSFCPLMILLTCDKRVDFITWITD